RGALPGPGGRRRDAGGAAAELRLWAEPATFDLVCRGQRRSTRLPDTARRHQGLREIRGNDTGGGSAAVGPTGRGAMAGRRSVALAAADQQRRGADRRFGDKIAVYLPASKAFPAVWTDRSVPLYLSRSGTGGQPSDLHGQGDPFRGDCGDR